MTTLSATVEQVMDTTYLDPMNSMSDSAVYSGISQASESDFDSTFGIGEPSGYLGLSFRDMERRHDEEYTSLHSELRREGSFAMARSTGTGTQATYGDGSGLAGGLAVREKVGNTYAKQPRGQGLYDEPNTEGTSAIYASGDVISPYEYGFGFQEGEYSPFIRRRTARWVTPSSGGEKTSAGPLPTIKRRRVVLGSRGNTRGSSRTTLVMAVTTAHPK